VSEQNAMGGATLRERDARVIADIARLRFSPLSLVGGRGNRLIEEGGRELLDLSASFGPAILGYSHPAITQAVAGACARMAGASLLAFPNETAVALAEDLLRLTPGTASVEYGLVIPVRTPMIAPCAWCKPRPADHASFPLSGPITAAYRDR